MEWTISASEFWNQWHVHHAWTTPWQPSRGSAVVQHVHKKKGLHENWEGLQVGSAPCFLHRSLPCLTLLPLSLQWKFTQESRFHCNAISSKKTFLTSLTQWPLPSLPTSMFSFQPMCSDKRSPHSFVSLSLKTGSGSFLISATPAPGPALDSTLLKWIWVATDASEKAASCHSCKVLA